MKKGLLAALLYLLFATLFVSEGLFSPKVGICIDSLYTLQPWDDMGYEMAGGYNPALDHQAFFVVPWMKYAFQFLREGHIPLWTHLAGGGSPFMGNLSSATFFPLNVLGWVVPFHLFWSLAGLIKLWLAAFLTYGLLRLYRLKFFSAFLGGLAFGFSGFMICWMNHPHSNVALFIPALFLSAEYFVRQRNGPALFLNALLLGIQSLGGSPETSALLFIIWGGYILYRYRQEDELFSADGMRFLLYLGITGLLGGALAAFQLWPFFEYLYYSYGLEIRHREWSCFLNGGVGRLLTPVGICMGLLLIVFLGSFFGLLQRKNTVFVGFWSGLLGGLCLIVAARICFLLGARPHLLMQVLPELYGPAVGGCPTSGNISFAALNGGYAGVITAFIALYTFMAPCKRRPLPFFIILFICSFGAAHSIPWLTHIIRSIPLVGMVHNSSLLSLTAFAIAVIAPFGLEDLIYRAAKIEGKSAAVAGMAGTAFIVGWAVVVSGWNFFETGVDLVEAERSPDPALVISEPPNGSNHDCSMPLIIRGRARAEVIQIEGQMDHLLVGKKRTHPQAEDPAFDAARQAEVQAEQDPKKRAFKARELALQMRLEKAYPRTFEIEYALNTVDDGTYKIHVRPSLVVGEGPEETLEKESEGDWTDIRVVRPKKVTFKDLAFLVLSALVFMFLLCKSLPARVRATLVISLLFADLFFFGLGFNKTSHEADIFPPTDLTDFLAAQKKPYRVFAEGGILQPNTNFLYDIEHMEWDDRLGIAGYWKICNQIKLDHLAVPKQLNVFNFKLNHPLFNFMGVKYALVKTDFDLSQFDQFKLVHDGPVRVYENVKARDRAFVVGDWISLEDCPLEEVARSDLRNLPVFLEDPPVQKGGSGTVEFLEYQDDHIRLAVETRGQGMLILTENDYPGWKAYVDGKETPILLASGTFRAVALEVEGRHEVVFHYHPLSFYGGIYLALSALILSLLIAVIPALTRPLRRKAQALDTISWSD